MTLCVEGIWRSFEDRLPNDIYTAQCSLSAARFERCVPSEMKIKRTRVSPSLSVD
jgi:hypothetical protein